MKDHSEVLNYRLKVECHDPHKGLCEVAVNRTPLPQQSPLNQDLDKQKRHDIILVNKPSPSQL